MKGWRCRPVSPRKRLKMPRKTILALVLALAAPVLFGARDTMPPEADIAQNAVYTVVIDPAHGGGEWGVNIHGVMEKDINLKVAKLIKQKLERSNSGITVFLTRENDSFLTPAARAGFANGKKASVFISIHCDYSANPQVEGYKVYYSEGENIAAKTDAKEVIDWTRVQLYHIEDSMKLSGFISQYMQASLIPETGAGSSAEANSTVAGKYRKEQSAALVSLEGVDMPAAVVELGNLNNQNDLSYLKDDKALNTMAYHIKEAISYFLKEKK